MIRNQAEKIEKLEKIIKEKDIDYAILEEEHSKMLKKEAQGPIVFVGNIISKYHKLCSKNSPDPYFWPKHWFAGLQDKIVYDYKKTE